MKCSDFNGSGSLLHQYFSLARKTSQHSLFTYRCSKESVMNNKIAFFSLLFSATVFAQPPVTPPGNAPPQDVNVVNSPDVTVINSNSAPVPVTLVDPSSGIVEYRLVGISTAKVQGNIGINGLHDICQQEFGPLARACITEEAVSSPQLSTIFPELGQNAWMMPRIVGGYLDSTNNSRVVDVTGISVNWLRGLNCAGWRTNNSDRDGAVLHRLSDGLVSIGAVPCNTTNSIACCSPRQQ